MNRKVSVLQDELKTLAEEARALLEATADAAEENVIQARERLSSALRNGHGLLGRVQKTAVQSARAANESIHHHPYRALGIAFGLGAIFALMMRRD